MIATRTAWCGSVALALSVGLSTWAAPVPFAAAEELPAVDERCMNDHARLIGKKDRAAIRSLCEKSKRDGVHMMVVTVRTLADYHPQPLSLDRFADTLFDEWDLEYDAVDDAILLFVARKERQIRVRLGEGYALRAWRNAEQILRRTIGPNLGRRPSLGLRRGVARLYHEVAKPHVKAKKRKEQAEARKRGRVDFD